MQLLSHVLKSKHAYPFGPIRGMRYTCRGLQIYDSNRKSYSGVASSQDSLLQMSLSADGNSSYLGVIRVRIKLCRSSAFAGVCRYLLLKFYKVRMSFECFKVYTKYDYAASYTRNGVWDGLGGQQQCSIPLSYQIAQWDSIHSLALRPLTQWAPPQASLYGGPCSNDRKFSVKVLKKVLFLQAHITFPNTFISDPQ